MEAAGSRDSVVGEPLPPLTRSLPSHESAVYHDDIWSRFRAGCPRFLLGTWSVPAYVGLGDLQGEGEYYDRHRDHRLSGVHHTIPGRTSHACPVRNPTTGHFSCSAACKDNRGCIRDLLSGPDKESHQVDRQGSLLTRLEADRIQEIAQDVLCAAESLEVAMSMQRAGSG